MPTPARFGRIGVLNCLSLFFGIVILALLIVHSLTPHAVEHHEPHAPSYWGFGILPFLGILGSIAFLPLISRTHHWWENNLNRLAVSLLCAGATLLYFGIAVGPGSITTVLEHAIVIEYIPFIVLLFSLYVISGGVCLRGELAAKPLTNTAILAFGAGIASFIGTTGASMLLIRPLLKTNAQRRHVVHTVVFFIFLVSNIGGTLLPIGDPPLFLGFLRGVPFEWTLGLWSHWAFTCAVLLVIYFIWETIAYRRETPEAKARKVSAEHVPLRLQGWSNVALLIGIVFCVAFVDPQRTLPGTDWKPFPFMRELLMLALVGLSLFATPRGVRAYNQFNYAAILEVAACFIGIFIAMQVPLEVLSAYGVEISKVINQPWQFFWATGALSSFLDNAPTYVVFFQTAETMGVTEGEEVVSLFGERVISAGLLAAISLGAVFMGAMTYIGNGPNFMVKAIAEQSGVRMPSFFGFLFKYSIPILIPLFFLVTILFLL